MKIALDNIDFSSFMIISQPHYVVNPVIIYYPNGRGEFKAKVSVTIVSLLHDFMVTHPNLIELYDIGKKIMFRLILNRIDICI